MRSILLAVAGLALTLAPAFAQPQQRPAQGAAQPGQPRELSRSGAWIAYAVDDAQRGRSCYVLGTPQSADPPVGPNRTATNLFITHRPRQNVRNEIAVVIGYPFRGNAAARLEIVAAAGNQTFQMMTNDRSAFVQNPAQEAQIVTAMRGGRELVIRGTSQRGTATTDRYSLTGISAALDRIAQECR